MAKIVKINNISIKLPDKATIHRYINLDKLYQPSVQRSDILLILLYKKLKYVVIIEDTGRVKIKDFERLNKTLEDLKEKKYLPQEAVFIKIIHHKGIKSGRALISRIKMRYRVELQECRYRFIDLEQIFKRYGW